MIREKLSGAAKGDTDYVFVSWSGNRMTSSMVTTQMSNFFNKGVGRSLQVRMNPTVMRKCTTTVVHTTFPGSKQVVADHLSHSLSTAEKSYYKASKQSNAASTSKCIKNALRATDVDLIEIFSNEIKNGTINIATVRAKLSNVPDMSLNEEKRILDLVRYQIRKKSMASTSSASSSSALNNSSENSSSYSSSSSLLATNLPPATSSPLLVPSKSANSDIFVKSSRERKVFSSEDNRLIKLHLRGYIKKNTQIIRSEFEEFVRGIPELEGAIEKFGITSLITKVRTERKR